MDDYVAKPVKPKELDVVLKRWILQPETAATISEAGGNLGSATDDPIDRSVLARLRELQEEGEPDFLNELIAQFLDDVPPQLRVLREAVEGGDAHSVERIAHTLKGSCGNLGAVRMAAICSELQDVSASKDLLRAPTLVERLEEEFGRVRPALETAGARSRE